MRHLFTCALSLQTNTPHRKVKISMSIIHSNASPGHCGTLGRKVYKPPPPHWLAHQCNDPDRIKSLHSEVELQRRSRLHYPPVCFRAWGGGRSWKPAVPLEPNYSVGLRTNWWGRGLPAPLEVSHNFLKNSFFPSRASTHPC